jgi:hypothetical protein
MPRTKGAVDKKPRRVPVKAKIDWETLAKNLQKALAAEIKENDMLRENNTKLITQGIKLLGAIEYLENARGNN